MFIHWRFFAAAFFSFALGILLFFWALLQPKSGSWITVYTDARLNDRELNGLLKGQGFSVVSESNLWVLLDTFNGVQQIPLDEYNVEDFDPRNDGYAERLRSFFVQGRERRFFIKKDGISPAALETILDKTLGPGRGVLWKIEYSGEYGFEPLLLLLFTAAFVLCMIAAGRSFFFFLLCTFPVIAFLSFAGPAGLAASGMALTAVWLLKEPLEERFRTAFGPSRIIRLSFAKEVKGWFNTFFGELLGVLSALILYWICCVLGNIPLRVSLPVFCFLVPVLLFSSWAESRRINEFYFPLTVQKNQFLLLFPSVLPVFTIAFALAFGMYSRQGFVYTKENNNQDSPGSAEWPLVPDPEHYYRHAAFQQSFSLQSLSIDHSGSQYGTYGLGTDGLIGGFTEIPPGKIVPPYPELLVQVGKEPGDSRWRKLSAARGIILLAFMVIFSVPSLLGMFRYRKKKQGVV